MDVVPARVHHTHVLLVVDGPRLGLERQVGVLRDGEAVHVGPHRDHGSRPPADHHAGHTGMSDSRLHLHAELAQVMGHQLRRLELPVAELRVLVDPMPVLERLLDVSIHAGLDLVVENCAGALSEARAADDREDGGERRETVSVEHAAEFTTGVFAALPDTRPRNG